MGFFEEFKETQAMNDSLIAVEVKADTTKVDTIKPPEARKEKVEKLVGGYNIDPALQPPLIEGIVAAGEHEKENIVGVVSDIREQKEAYKKEQVNYLVDQSILKDVNENLPLFKTTRDYLYKQTFPTLAEKIFGSSDKDMEDKYNKVLKSIEILESRKEAIDSKWNAPKGYTSAIQSQYESYAGRESGGTTFFDEVRDPERFAFKGKPVSRKSRLDELGAKVAGVGEEISSLESLVAEYKNLWQVGTGAEEEVFIQDALDEIEFMDEVKNWKGGSGDIEDIEEKAASFYSPQTAVNSLNLLDEELRALHKEDNPNMAYNQWVQMYKAYGLHNKD